MTDESHKVTTVKSQLKASIQVKQLVFPCVTHCEFSPFHWKVCLKSRHELKGWGLDLTVSPISCVKGLGKWQTEVNRILLLCWMWAKTDKEVKAEESHRYFHGCKVVLEAAQLFGWGQQLCLCKSGRALSEPDKQVHRNHSLNPRHFLFKHLSDLLIQCLEPIKFLIPTISTPSPPPLWRRNLFSSRRDFAFFCKSINLWEDFFFLLQFHAIIIH